MTESSPELSLKLPQVDYSKCVGSVENVPSRFCVCQGCFRYVGVEPACHQRNCPKCQLAATTNRYHTYEPALQKIKTGFRRRWINVTLTGFHVPEDSLALYVQAFSEDARNFLKEHYAGGLFVVEHTRKSDGYYIHGHALVLGDFQDQKKLSEEWGRFVFLQDLRKDKRGRERSKEEYTRSALRYVLKYITKGVELPDEKLAELKGLRYISTFGELYNMGLPKIVHRCKFCNGNIFLARDEDIEIIERDKMAKGPEPLELQREITWPVRRRKASKVEQEETSNRLKQFVKDLWFGAALPTGVNLLVRWLLYRPGVSVAESVGGYQ